MPIELNPTFHEGTASFEDSILFRNTSLSSEFLQVNTVPFSITLTSCHTYDHSLDTYSVFVPNGQFNGSMRQTIHGRSAQSMHSHNYFELAYILDGNLRQLVEGNEYLYPVGSCCLLNRSTMHTEQFDTSYRALFLSITSDMVETMHWLQKSNMFREEEKNISLIFSFLYQNLQPSHEDSKDFLDFVPRIEEKEQKKLVHDIFEKMILTMISPYNGATTDIYKYIGQLFDILCSDIYYQGIYVSPSTRTENLLFARINHILSECDGRISNHELSELLNYNGTYLGRIVKKNTGMSLFDYSMTFTMKAAARYLTTTSMTVSEIMDVLHFNNQTHFYQLFRNHYQMTPSAYRKQHATG